ncbi:MAG: twin-arginine translocase subunit TatC [Porticoccaceae bacterium]|jgi:sec-independent protein translocase protein TatC|nr:twin-arginine translocase subunit TatC [Porticoccaceae bacterium]
MAAEPQDQDTSQPLLSHLIELRSRLLRICFWVLLVFLCLFYFSNDIYSIVSQPLKALLPESSSMIATDVASPFFAPFKLTLVVSVLLAMPIVLYQIWAFIAPGLYQRERRIAIPLLISSVSLFYAGMAFAYFVVFPILFGFFTATGPEDVKVMTDISSYLDFVLKLFFAFGIAFQIPIAVVILCWTGITTAERLAAKRPYVVVGCFVVGMLLTPPDIFSQTLLAVPMWLLFELGVICGRAVVKESDGE